MRTFLLPSIPSLPVLDTHQLTSLSTYELELIRAQATQRARRGDLDALLELDDVDTELLNRGEL